MDHKSKQEIQSVVSEAMSKFLKDQMGEQAEAVVTQVVDDTIIVRFKGVLTPAEKYMIKEQEGGSTIKKLKEKLIERVRPLLEVMIKKLIDAEVVDIHSSFDPATGEHIEILTLSRNLEKSSTA